MKVVPFLLWLLIGILVIPQSTEADAGHTGRSLNFLQLKGGHSIDSLFGVPTPLPPITPSDQLRLSFGHANMFAAGVGENSIVLLDGERSRLSLAWTHAWTSCLRTGIELPFIAHADGYFDGAIEGWHDIFQLPNANREETPRDQLNIVYQDPTGERLQVDSAVAEHGDVTLSLLWSIGCNTDAATESEKPVVRVGLKLPTGRYRALTGSGEPDLFLDVTSATRHWGDWSARASLGAVLLGQSDLFSIQERAAAFGVLALGWQMNPRFQPMVQLDWHTALFDSTLRELGQFTAVGTVGFVWEHSKRLTSEFGLLEDLVPDTAPDIGLHYSLRFSY